jgi:uncharacterized protein
MTDEQTEQICEVINGVSFSKNRGVRPKTIEGKIVQHFYDKLLLLKGEMNTEAGKRIAEERHDFMEQFLKELQKEQSK